MKTFRYPNNSNRITRQVATNQNTSSIVNDSFFNESSKISSKNILNSLNFLTPKISTKPYVTDGLQLYLDGSDYSNSSTSTTWMDKSGNNINGTLTNFAFNSTTSGWTGTALAFDGVDDRISVGKNAALEPSSAITIELRINKNALIKYGKLLWYGDNNSAPWGSYGFERDTNNQNINFHIATNSVYTQLAIPATNIPDNTDLHIVARYNGSAMTVYVNNSLVATTSKTGTITYSNVGLYIGDCNIFGSVYTGNIYFVRIYNRALTNEEITQNYIATTSKNAEVIVPIISSNINITTPSISNSVNIISNNILNSVNSKIPKISTKPYVTDGLQLYLDAKDYPNGSTSTIWKSKVTENYTYNNYIVNGHFDSIDNWAIIANWSLANSIVTMTGDGNVSSPNAYQAVSTIPNTGDKFYIKAKFMVQNSSCSSVIVEVNHTQYTLVSNPIANQWYDIGFITNGEGTGYALMKILFVYVDAATANGKVQQIDYFMISNLTQSFGVGNEPKDINWCNANMPFVATNGIVAKGFDGTLNNFSYTTTSGWNNNKLVFDGVNDTVNIVRTNTDLTNFTIEFKLKIKDNTGNRFANFGTYSPEIRVWNGNLQAFWTKWIDSFIPLSLNTIYHLIFKKEGNNVSFYVNNTKSNTISINATIGNNIVLGEMFSGEMSFVRLYNRALTDTEITQNYMLATIENTEVIAPKVSSNVSLINPRILRTPNLQASLLDGVITLTWD